ncbi:MAG: hypothetical protein B7Y99_07450 [Caulobacterales bacterium 32-69-10]|nr:MAG: hypothetical protein B7Y99_07450 [Caulobacterales bacterium 32-69-10]
MMMLLLAYARSFVRDRAGLAMTLILPPLVYLLFAAIFGSSASGKIDVSAALHDGARTEQSRRINTALTAAVGERLTLAGSPSEVEQAVIDGRIDAGVLLAPSSGPIPRIEVLGGAGRDVASATLAATLEQIAATVSGQAAGRAPLPVIRRQVGPAGDVQAVYYAGAVSVMFVFFAAMHGAMVGLDERRSGLQARLVLAAGALWPILASRAAWLAIVGLAQTAAVFAIALPRLPSIQPWQGLAWMVTASMTAAAAAGVAMGVIALCRSREQAQPLSTFLVLLLAALGGSMAPRFLMPETFRQLGWLTPHAWAIEAYQSLIWRGRFDGGVVGAWVFLGGLAALGWTIALVVENRRTAR